MIYDDLMIIYDDLMMIYDDLMMIYDDLMVIYDDLWKSIKLKNSEKIKNVPTGFEPATLLSTVLKKHKLH